jgi:hypothetical protein
MVLRSLKTTLVLLTCLASFTACTGSASSSQDLSKLVTVTDVKTGYFDTGVENGMNKLVPALMLKLKNVSNETLSLLQLNAVIRRVGETEEWGGAYTKAVGSPGLKPGAETDLIVLRSNLGYTSIEPRAQMLKHRLFVDAHVQLFGKLGGAQWVKLGEYPIAREVLTQ